MVLVWDMVVKVAEWGIGNIRGFLVILKGWWSFVFIGGSKFCVCKLFRILGKLVGRYLFGMLCNYVLVICWKCWGDLFNSLNLNNCCK